MAKSGFDLKGAKGPKLELDLLRLLYAVQNLQKKGEKAYGYLIVSTNKIKERAESWIKKYEFEKKTNIEILTLDNLDEKTIKLLKDEKVRNALANIRHKRDDIRKELASGRFGQGLYENALENYLKNKHHIKEIKQPKMPFEIRWDFYHCFEK